MFNCPLSAEKASRLIEQLHLDQTSHVVDIGCGEGELLIHVAERYGITGVGIDLRPDLITLAKQQAATRLPDNLLFFLCQDAQHFDWSTHRTNLIICIGSEFIFGGCRQALQLFSQQLTSTGKVLIGTVFWQQEPSPEYLQIMGGENPHFDYLTTVDIAIEEEFVPLYVCRSNEDEWDDFESRYTQKGYLKALDHADQEAFDQTQKWQRGYLRWGHATMGFAFLLLQKR